MKYAEAFKRKYTKRYTANSIDEAMQKMQSHYSLLCRLASFYSVCKDLDGIENLWKEDMQKAGITEENIKIALTYFNFSNKKEKEEQIAYPQKRKRLLSSYYLD